MSLVVLMTSIVTVSLKLISYISTCMKKGLKWKIIGVFHLFEIRSSQGGRKVLETRVCSTV